MWVTVVNWHWWKAGISGTLGLRLCKIFCRLFSLPAPPPPTSVILKATRCDEEITIWKPGTSLAVQWFTLPSNTEGVGSIPCQGAKSLYESEKMKVYSVVSDSLQPRGLYSPGILQARILEWVAFSFSRGSSHSRDPTKVFFIAGRFFTSWATREVQEYWSR